MLASRTTALAGVLDRTARSGHRMTMNGAPSLADWPDAIRRARDEAPFLCRGLDRLPGLAALLEMGQIEEALAFARHAGQHHSDVGIALRRERLALSIALAIGDLAGALPLSRVIGELSLFADRALDAAITAAMVAMISSWAPGLSVGIACLRHFHASASPPVCISTKPP